MEKKTLFYVEQTCNQTNNVNPKKKRNVLDPGVKQQESKSFYCNWSVLSNVYIYCHLDYNEAFKFSCKGTSVFCWSTLHKNTELSELEKWWLPSQVASEVTKPEF